MYGGYDGSTSAMCSGLVIDLNSYEEAKMKQYDLRIISRSHGLTTPSGVAVGLVKYNDGTIAMVACKPDSYRLTVVKNFGRFY